MNRKIKFRAWDTKQKKWLDKVPYLEYLLDDPDECVSHHDIDEEQGLYFYPDNPLGAEFKDRIIYQQYACLKDSNGKEIFEGDIIGETWLENNPYGYSPEDWRSCSHKYVVKFEGASLKLDSVQPHEQRCIEKCQRIVIGNIFENPELLT